MALSFDRKRLKHVVSLRQFRFNGGNDNRPYVGLENIDSRTGRLLKDPTTDSGVPITLIQPSSLSNFFEPGDVLFGKLRPYLAKAWVAEFAGQSSTELLVMRPVEVEPRFLRYICLWSEFVDAVDASTFGSKMPRAEWSSIGNVYIPLPDRAKQRAISDYLDRETARLDALMAYKDRLLSLLEEKRQALITSAVTQGLNPSVPLRDSDVPFMENIPAHWRTLRLRFLVSKIEQGWSPEAVGRTPEDDEWGVLKLNAVNQGGFDETAAKTLPADREPREALSVRPGDVLVTRSNTPPLVGDACYVEITRSRLMLSDLIYRLNLRSELIDGRFLVYFLTLPLARAQIEGDARGTSASMVKISQEHIRDWLVPVPPNEEQQEIVAKVASKTQVIDGIEDAAHRAIALLDERKTALIDAAVIGQIDVENGV